MILRLDRLLIDMPKSREADPDGAAAVQQLLGGKFGEMSTLMNYTFQSFNLRGRNKIRPWYDLIANIATEEYGHIELVSYAINLMLEGTTRPAPPVDAPLEKTKSLRNSYFWIDTGQNALPMDSMGQFWNGSLVYSTGNLVLDLVHNFFLEVGARTNKIRVYEMTRNPTAREMIGYLIVRGGVHILAYAKALEKLTGADVQKLLPIPRIENNKFPESRKWESQGVHRILYRFSPNDYRQIDQIWTGKAPDGGDLVVVDGPPKGAPVPDLQPIPEQQAPEYDPMEMMNLAQRLMKGYKG
jgi:Mn-containing catalase